GFGEVSYANLQGLGRRISLRGEASLAPPTFNTGDYLINLGFREPRLGASEWGFRLNVVAQRTTTLIYPYSLQRLAVIPGVERSWFSTLRAGMEVQADVSDVFDLKPDVLAFNPSDQGRLTTIALGPYVVYDGRDDAFVPHRGVFDSLRLRVAPSQLGSQIPFFKFVAQHTQYIPVSEDLTFVYAIRGGWGRAFESGTLVPIQDRFFLGGSTTVRGFSENSIGPQGSAVVNAAGKLLSAGDPVGGEWAINLNTELRFPLIYGLGGVIFVDGGGAYVHTLPISIHDFRRS